MEEGEKIFFSNTFGSVTDKRIILNHKSGTENISVVQITSISYKHSKNIVFAVGSFLVTIVCLLLISFGDFSNLGGVVILVILSVAIIGFISGIANWIGHHNIILSVGGRDRKPLRVEMSKAREGREFVDAVKAVMK